jgi:lysozyme
MRSKKKKRLVRSVFLLVLTALLILAGYIGYQWWLYGRARFVRYPEFGISIPIEYSIHGIDVSKYQQMIAWDAVSSMQVKKIKLGFVFIKQPKGLGILIRSLKETGEDRKMREWSGEPITFF